MLLRRITQHVKDQNWFAVLIDFAIVVFGVFIGLQVANWNEARGDRQDESRYLVSLDEDMRETINSIDHIVEQLGKHEKAREKLFEHSLGTGEKIKSSELPKLISEALWQFHAVEFRTTTFDTLRNSGRLAVLGDEALITALQDLAAFIEEANGEMQMESHVLQNLTDPLLFNEVEMAAVMTARGLESGQAHVSWIRVQPGEFVEPDIVATQKFRNALLFRSASTSSRVRSYQDVRSKCLELRDLISRRQTVLGHTK